MPTKNVLEKVCVMIRGVNVVIRDMCLICLDASVEVDDIRITSVHHVGRGVKPA